MNRKISVIMGIFNCANTLCEAVESIEKQTYSNWELIMCDDGSEDNTFYVASQLAEKDRRIILLKNEKNLGLNETLNHCLRYATGDFVARMDGDDLCDPTRFEKQVAVLEQKHNIEIVSSTMKMFDAKGVWGTTSTIEYPTCRDVVVKTPIHHAPVMMWKKCMDAVGGYTVDPRMIRVEDVNLWIKMYAAGFRCYNIQEPLYMMRNDENALNRREYRYRLNSVHVRLQGCRILHLGPECYLLAFKPAVAGLVPAKIRSRIRRDQQRKRI